MTPVMVGHPVSVGSQQAMLCKPTISISANPSSASSGPLSFIGERGCRRYARGDALLVAGRLLCFPES